jgi:hypothetical protein
MRVKLLLENSAAQDLVDTLQEEEGTEIQSVGIEKDLTEQAFGIAELGAIIAVVKGAVQLAGAIRRFARRPGATRSTLTIETAVGNAKVELSREMSEEEILALVSPLFPTP